VRSKVTTSKHSEGDVTVLELTGGLTLTNGVERLRGDILELLRTGHNRIAVDLSHVPDMDSAGLGELVRSHVATTKQHGEFSLLHVPRHVRKMLAVTRLATVLRCGENTTANAA
jgi:anti-sigma B factor antagonist